MSSSAVKKKHVRFAAMEDDDNDEQDEDTLFDKRTESSISKGLKSALKAAKRSTSPAREQRVQVVGGGRGGGTGTGACGRWMVTLLLSASFLGLGMGISVLGPTFQDLAVNVKKNISNISYIFVGRSAGYIGGSLLGGLLFELVNPHLLLGLSMLVTAFGMCAIPFCTQAVMLTVFMSSIGMSMGVLDTGGNVLILKTWGEQGGPHMQALHFSFAAGAFVSPIIAKMLFGPDGNGSVGAAPTNSTPPAATDQVPNVSDAHSLVNLIHSRSGTLKSVWAYTVIGTFIGLISLFFFVLYSRSGTTRDKPRTSSGKPLVAKHNTALVVLLFFFFFGYVGAEVAYGSFIFTYARDYMQMPQSQAAWLNSLFWATFAACRGFAIFFATCVYPGTLILCSLVGSTISSLLLCLLGKEESVLWICTGLYGASMATTFPSGISWVEQYTTVTGNMASVFVVGSALGEMVLPAIVGFMWKYYHQPLLMYLSLVTATFTSILFPVMYKLASAPDGQSRKPRAVGRPEADDSEFRQALLDSGTNDEEEEEEEGEEEVDTEADQWNDADFEVIEMDDAASLLSSPSKASSPPDISGSMEPLMSDSLVGDSPRHKLLLADREKRD